MTAWTGGFRPSDDGNAACRRSPHSPPWLVKRCAVRCTGAECPRRRGFRSDLRAWQLLLAWPSNAPTTPRTPDPSRLVRGMTSVAEARNCHCQQVADPARLPRDALPELDGLRSAAAAGGADGTSSRVSVRWNVSINLTSAVPLAAASVTAIVGAFNARLVISTHPRQCGSIPGGRERNRTN